MGSDNSRHDAIDIKYVQFQVSASGRFSVAALALAVAIGAAGAIFLRLWWSGS